ncbi:MAG TPA: helix-turn-helix domain-containing protein, partial [Turneriella sp.]|nr:helix-turn-helix domain-containing protein [Turneriella sp.]
AGGEKDTLSLELVERHYIAAVCERYAWQVTDAARHLGISRKTLYDKMRRYKLARPEKGGSGSQRAS